MGTLFALMSVFFALGSFIAAFRPSLVRQSSRFKAFAFCWIGAIICAVIGSAFDGYNSWSSVFWTSGFLALVYCVAVFFITSIRNVRLSPSVRQHKFDKLKLEKEKLIADGRALFHDTGKKVLPHREELSDSNDIRFTPRADNRTVIKDKNSKIFDRFEQSLTTMWAGDIKPMEFTYVNGKGERTRRTVEVDEVSFNDKGQFYLRGYCRLRNEYRTFKVDNIETKLKVGSKRYDFEEWCVYVLDIIPSEGFPKSYLDRYHQ